MVTLGAKPPAALWFMVGLVAAIGAQTRPEEARREVARSAARRAGIAVLVLTGLAVVVVVSGVAQGNVGAVRAHRVLFAARSGRSLAVGEAERAQSDLEAALERRPQEATLQGLLGSLQAWRGDEAAAVGALRRRVALDGPRALRRYAPFVGWQRWLEGAPEPEPWSGTQRLHRTWQNRFLRRAENYVLEAIVLAEYRGDVPGAVGLVQRGMERGAVPVGVLRWYGEGE